MPSLPPHPQLSSTRSIQNPRHQHLQIMKSSSANHQTSLLVLKSAIASRLLLLILVLLWRFLLQPYDTSAPLNPTCLSPSSSSADTVLFPRVAEAIENGVVWDSVYFVRIAECGGYEYEQSFAFLPLLPILMSLLSRTLLAPLVPLIGLRAVLALAGYLVNNAAFVLAGVYFYRLSARVLRDPNAAFRASVLFCFNPASIFYSSIYTESLYAVFSVGGLYYWMSSANNLAVALFALSGCARSNGVLNAGYFCFQTMHLAYDAAFVKRRNFLAVRVIIAGVIRCICIFVPFLAFQAYGYYNLCHGRSVDEMRPWCKARIPLLYNFIQSHYWGVGFLRYFQFRQLPNFLLASPILSLAVCSIIHYVKSQPKTFFSLGFQASKDEVSVASCSSKDSSPVSKVAHMKGKSSAIIREDENLQRRKKVVKEVDKAVYGGEYDPVGMTGYLSALIVPCTLHLGFMTATALFIMHVQVATRFLSSSPPLYWFASYMMASPGLGRRWGYIIWAYSVAYILLGSLLFSNFYPFT